MCAMSIFVGETLDCTGQHRYHARGTAYYPDDSPIEGGFFDMKGARLHTLQVDFHLIILDKKVPSNKQYPLHYWLT